MKQLKHSAESCPRYMPVAPAEEPRYAIYYTPAEHSPLTAAAEAWLGRSAFAGTRLADVDQNLPDQGLVSEPSRYGFHATLKPPFRMAADRTIADLEDDLSAFAAQTEAFPIGRLKLARVRGFFALIPASPLLRLETFAALIVENFDHFRAPFTTNELQRRMKDGLDDDEATLLVRWGYPYVFERFQFHLTLTNTIPAEDQASIEAKLRRHFGTLLDRDYAIDTLSLFEQSILGGPFRVRASFPLAKGGNIGL